LDIGDVNSNPFTLAEITGAIKGLKNGKAAGVDNLCAELLKAGSREMTEWLLHLCNNAWEQETVPQEWKKGIIVKLSKK
jgi:hypothetical protein